jgi:hypothetical protein
MTRTLRGVIHGRTVELTEDPGAADGQQVEITIKTIASPKPWGEGLRRCAGAFAADWTEEDDRIMEELHRERKAANRNPRSQTEATTW